VIAKAWARESALPLFVVLQFLDMMTTLIFLRAGVAEGNPLVTLALAHGHAPWTGLIAVKIIATMIGLICYRTGRFSTLRLANAGYSLIVGWNLLAIAVTALAHL
jgi:hypothetical protein